MLQSRAIDDHLVEDWPDSSGHDWNKGRLCREYRGAAEGTIGVTLEPFVDAINMKRVVTNR